MCCKNNGDNWDNYFERSRLSVNLTLHSLENVFFFFFFFCFFIFFIFF